jgi:E3 ubiquitin-protein ligase RGLG
MGCSESHETTENNKNHESNKDDYKSLDAVVSALRKAGLEASQLIIGVDFTKSNTWQGTKTFGGRCLHDIVPGHLNHYETAISAIGQSLAHFDDDNQIPTYGFGCLSTQNHSVFAFNRDEKSNIDLTCHGVSQVLSRYREISHDLVTNRKLSGGTSFVPMINKAIEITKTLGSYHILIILADGTMDDIAEIEKAIVRASDYPLSIIVIGVGDGECPDLGERWPTMKKFDDSITGRKFDNLQFVDFVQVMKQGAGDINYFALHSLMEIPAQYKFIKKSGLIGFKAAMPAQQTTTFAIPSAPPPAYG